MSYRTFLLAMIALLQFNSVSQAQNRFYHVYVDNDDITTTGCDVNIPAFATTIEGVQSRLTITTDSALPPNIVATNLHQCNGASFDAGTAVTPAALGLNTGVAGADVLEAGVDINSLGINSSGNVRLYFATQSDTASDIVLTSTSGGPIYLGFTFPVPALGYFALGMLLLLLAFSARKNIHKKMTLSIVLIGLSTLAYAMNIVIDGQTGDWSGLNPANTDPINDTSASGSFADLTAVFVTKNANNVFVRMDVVDVENQAPLADATSDSTLEDTAVTITVTGSDPEGSAVTFSAGTAPGNGTLSAFTVINATTSTVTYTPSVNFNGNDQFTIVANDGQVNSAAATVTVSVNPVNDAPSFTSGGSVNVLKTVGAYSEIWATNVTAGPSDEATQNLTFNITANDNPALFSSAPSIDSSGVLIFTGVNDATGTANITVELMDDGGTANGGIDTSAGINFAITLQGVNDEPSFTAGPDQNANEDAGAVSVPGWATAILAGPPDESGQVLAFNVTANSNPSLFSAGPAVAANGDLTYTPAADANGVANITIELMDDGGTANGGDDTSPPQSFTITITAVNDAPSFAAGANQNVLEDAPAQTVNGWATAISAGPTDESAQTVSFNVTNNNNALFTVQPAIDPAGNLTFTPALGQLGSADVDVTISDNGGTANGGIDTSVIQTFTISVTAVNDEPSFTAGPDQNANEDAGAVSVPGWATAILAGPPDESGQVLTFNVTANSNPSLFSAGPAVAANGDLTYTPAADANGVANISIVLMDDGGTANGGDDTSGPQSFNITITAVNDAPSFSAGANQNVLEESGTQTVNAWATAISAGPADESAQTVSFNVTNNNNALFSVQPAVDAAGNLSYTPTANTSGTATVSVSAVDDGGTANGGVDTSAAQNFTITITGINDAPSFTAAANPAASNEDGGAESVAWASAISAGPPDEAGQTLTFNVTQTSIDPTLSFAIAPTVNNTTGNVEYTAAANAFGSASYDVVLMDNGGTANGGIDVSSPAVTLTITVNPVNDPPSLTPPGPFAVTSHIRISVVDGANDLLAGATDVEPGTTLSIDDLDGIFATVSGGTVTANLTTGAFTYDPPAGFNGPSDSFQYRVCDDGTPAPAACSAMQTVTFNVSGNKVWFIDSAAAVGGNGTLVSPFNSLGNFDSSLLTAAGDFIYLASGNYTGSGIALMNNQTMFSEGATGVFDTIAGITAAPLSIARPTLNGVNPTINSTANGINLASNNTILGIDINNTTNYGLSGTVVGNLRVDDVSVTGNGGAIDVSTSGSFGTNVNFTQLDSNTNTISGINLVAVTGTLSVSNPGLGLTNTSAAPALRIFGGTLNLNYPGNINNTAGRSVDIFAKTTGTINLTGSVVDSGTGIILGNNTGATFNFSSLDLDTTTNTAFTALGGGTINLTGSNNTIDTTTGMAVSLANVTVGASGFNLNRVNVNGANTGIVLDTVTGTGQFRITGTGTTDSSGGTIQNNSISGFTAMNSNNIDLRNLNFNNSTNESIGCVADVIGVTGLCHAAIEIINTSDINLVNTLVDGNGDASDELGIFGQNVTNFDMDGVTVRNVSDAINEHGIYIVNLIGTGVQESRWQDLTVNNIIGDTAVLVVQNSGTGSLVIDGDTTLSNALDGGFEARTTTVAANLTVTLGDASAVGAGETMLIENTSTGALFFADNGTLTANVRNSVIQPGAGIPSIVRGGSGTNGVMFVGISAQSSGTTALVTLNATGNDNTQEDGGAGGTGRSNKALGGSRNISGNIANNIIESNDEYVRGYFSNFTGIGSTATNTVTIDSNTFNMSGSGTNETIVGIEYSAHNSNGGLSMTVIDNDVFSAGDNSFSGGIVVLAGDTGNDDSNTVCNDITGNQSSAAAATIEGDDYVFVKFTGSEFQLENPIVGVLNEAQIDAHIINNDSGTSLATDVTVIAVSGTFSGVNTSCPQ